MFKFYLSTNIFIENLIISNIIIEIPTQPKEEEVLYLLIFIGIENLTIQNSEFSNIISKKLDIYLIECEGVNK